MTVKIAKTLVTRDKELSKTPIALWELNAEDYLHVNEEGMWEADNFGCFVTDLSEEEFKTTYKLDPPAPGEQKTLVATYSWEK